MAQYLLLFEEGELRQVASLRAQASEKLGGVSTGIGFWGSPEWALGGAAVLSVLEGMASNRMRTEGIALLGQAEEKEQSLMKHSQFFPPEQIENAYLPYPSSWMAILDEEEPYSMTRKKSKYIHSGREFVTLNTAGGVVHVRWSEVAAYRYADAR